jgi:hypothetical protein
VQAVEPPIALSTQFETALAEELEGTRMARLRTLLETVAGILETGPAAAPQ